MMQTADRNFDPKSVAGLSAEARKALNAAFDAMSASASGIATARIVVPPSFPEEKPPGSAPSG